MRLLTPSQAYELDNISIKSQNISGVELMGNAGRCVAKKAIELLKNIQNPSIFIICGKGNNGGDGFATAKILHRYGYRVILHSIIPGKNIKLDALKYHNDCKKLGIPNTYGIEIPIIKKPNLIIDGLLGIGFKGKLRKEIIPWINWINNSNLLVLSIDIPSGLNGSSGSVLSECIKANTTVTFGAPKLGMVFRNGPNYTGQIKIADIGFLKINSIKLSGIKWKQYSEPDVNYFLKVPNLDLNKYSSGKVLIVAGSKTMTGAAILSTYGALRCGTGLTITTAPSSLNNIYERSIIEGMTLPLEDFGFGIMNDSNFEDIMKKVEWADSVLVGPGMGRKRETKKLIKRLVKHVDKPLVLDADGLYPYNGKIDELNKREHPLVITPHIGELSKLIGVKKDLIILKFPDIMNHIYENFNHISLIKQIPNCIFKNENAIINKTGNPGLATAGTGDVLAGIISGFIAQGLDPFDAASLGSFIHGKASDILIQEKGYRGQIASDLLDKIPEVISEYERS